MNDRVIAPQQTYEDNDQENRLRPQSLFSFVGQEPLKENLNISIEAALQREEALDHCLFAGPPGLGKTTLAGIISEEMNSKLHITSGPILDKGSDLAGVLTSLQEGDVLFIDEIHRLPRTVEEYLYSAMEDFRLDIMVESGANARSISLPIKPFTLVGATTRSGLLTSPLRDRFGLQFRLQPYSPEELSQILIRSSEILDVPLTSEAATLLASRCRGTPRIANRILRRCRDVAQVRGNGKIDNSSAEKTLSMLGVDPDGLDDMDRRILDCLINKFDGGPCGLSTIGTSIGEEADTIEEVYEPYLIQTGFLKRTARGRTATRKAYQKMGVKPPSDSQEELF